MFSGTVSSPALSDTFSVTVVPCWSLPASIWRNTSAMTATLIRLAVGKRSSALTETIAPVSRSLAKRPISPWKAFIFSSIRFVIAAAESGGGAAAASRRSGRDPSGGVQHGGMLAERRGCRA